MLGHKQKLYGTVAAIAADNLASNALGGFKEGSTAHRGCRQCMATPDDISTKVRLKDLCYTVQNIMRMKIAVL